MSAAYQNEGPALTFRSQDASIPQYSIVQFHTAVHTDGIPLVTAAVDDHQGVLFQCAKRVDNQFDEVTCIPLGQYASYIMIADAAGTIAALDVVGVSTDDNGTVGDVSGATASRAIGVSLQTVAAGEYCTVVVDLLSPEVV